MRLRIAICTTLLIVLNRVIMNNAKPGLKFELTNGLCGIAIYTLGYYLGAL